jgi:enterobactin synthetase component D
MGVVTAATDGASADIAWIERALARWLPKPAFVKAAVIGDHPILAEEQALVANAVDRRRWEFATGRWLARQGLRHFGLPERAIDMGRLRGPLWPEGVLGTITHDGALGAVALVQRRDVPERGIGIDLVSLSRRAARMQDMASMFVAGPCEIAAMAALEVRVDPALLLFSLKESAVKALAFQLEDFVDLRAIEVRRSGRLELSIAGKSVDAGMFAAATDTYLLTAVRIR